MNNGFRHVFKSNKRGIPFDRSFRIDTVRCCRPDRSDNHRPEKRASTPADGKRWEPHTGFGSQIGKPFRVVSANANPYYLIAQDEIDHMGSKAKYEDFLPL